MSFLYILYVNPLSDTWFANTFFHPMRVGKLAFCGVLFCWAEVFSLMERHLLILLFLLVLLVSYPKKSLSRLVTGGLSPMFSSTLWVLTVSHLTFKSLTNFELTFWMCLCAKLLQSCPTLCNPGDCSDQAPLSMGFSRQECWSGLPCPPLADLPDSGIKLMSLMSPAFTGRFFTTSTSWEAILWVISG